MSIKICTNCGKEFEPLKNAKGLYCSTSCYFTQKKIVGHVMAPQRVDRILKLYAKGMFIRPIARAVHTTFPRVKGILQKAGVFDSSRIRPQHVKGHKTLSPILFAHREICREYLMDLKAIKRFDESNHWKNHPERKRWGANRTAKSQYYKWRNCPTVVIRRRLRNRVNRVLRGSLKCAPTLTLLGCSLEQFKSHLESRFTRGMSWKNYGSAWHIDHKEPCSSFDLSNPEDQRRCFHFSNLQPLWAKANLCKRSRILPTQRELLINLNEKKAPDDRLPQLL